MTIPENVTSIERSAFGACNRLARIDVSEHNTKFKSLNGVLFDHECANIICYPAGIKNDSYIIPRSVTSIGESAFLQNTLLAEITIPDSVEWIGRNAFYGCYSLNNVHIPDSVTSIGIFAFSACSSLASFYRIPGKWKIKNP